MSNFTPAERIEIDRQYRILVKALHELDPRHTAALRAALSKAESAPTDPTLARVLVAREMLRGIAWEGRSPLTVRDMTLPAELAAALADAEKLGRAIGRFACSPRRGLFGFLLKRRTFGQSGKEALMHCRAIGAAHERRQSARRPGRGLRHA